MAQTKKESCFIHFMDGSSVAFEFDAPDDDAMSVANQLHNVINNNTMSFALDNKLVIIPIANIRSIEIVPAPTKLPPSVLHGARTSL